MIDKAKPETIHEAVGCFIDAKAIEATVAELHSTGFKHAEVSMLADEQTVWKSLGHLYADINSDAGEPTAPQTAFVAKEAVGDAVHTVLGALFFTGVTVAAGALVATAGAFGSAVLAAAAGIGAFGGVSAALSAVIDNTQADYIEEQIERGHLVLFVRTSDAAREAKTLAILKKHASLDPHIIEVAK